MKFFKWILLTALLVPTLLSAQITLRWQDNSSNETGFYIWRSENGVNYVKIGSVGANVYTFVDTQIVPAVKYYYKVNAYNNSGESGYTNVYAVSKNGSLINVSTRGFIGNDSLSLIPGFVIDNFGAKVLIRVVGPTLTTFGLTGVLDDPVFDLYKMGPPNTLILSNDDWQNDPEVSSVGSQVSAFPLTVNSKDAAVVVTLNPGTYTVVAKGKDDATGLGLVEVYQIR